MVSVKIQEDNLGMADFARDTLTAVNSKLSDDATTTFDRRNVGALSPTEPISKMHSIEPTIEAAFNVPKEIQQKLDVEPAEQGSKLKGKE